MKKMLPVCLVAMAVAWFAVPLTAQAGCGACGGGADHTHKKIEKPAAPSCPLAGKCAVKSDCKKCTADKMCKKCAKACAAQRAKCKTCAAGKECKLCPKVKEAAKKKAGGTCTKKK